MRNGFRTAGAGDVPDRSRAGDQRSPADAPAVHRSADTAAPNAFATGRAMPRCVPPDILRILNERELRRAGPRAVSTSTTTTSVSCVAGARRRDHRAGQHGRVGRHVRRQPRQRQSRCTASGCAAGAGNRDTDGRVAIAGVGRRVGCRPDRGTRWRCVGVRISAASGGAAAARPQRPARRT